MTPAELRLAYGGDWMAKAAAVVRKFLSGDAATFTRSEVTMIRVLDAAQCFDALAKEIGAIW